MAGKKQKGMKDNLDDILGDLLDEDAHVPPKKGQQASAKAKGKVGDDNFYSSIAASIENDADTSEMSDADVNQIAKSIGGLDDMDADLFNLSKKKPGSAKKQTTPRRPTTPRSKTSSAPRTPSPDNRVGSPTRSETPTSPPNSGRQNSTKRRPPKTGSPPFFPENRPGTSPGKMTDIGRASEELKPGQMSRKDERPHTQPKAKSKYDFGDFNEDDPLAGLLSDEDSIMADVKRPASPRKTVPKQPRPAEEPAKDKGTSDAPAVAPAPESKTPDSPLRGLLDRPPTRSGDGKFLATDVEKGDSVEKPKPAAKKRDEIIFSDDDDLMSGLGFDDAKAKAAEAAKAAARREDAESVRSASSYMDSLLGKDSASKHLEVPQKREFVLDKKYSKPQEEEDFAFGSYQPSAAFKARPKVRRAVRFQDDDIFGSDDKTPSRSHSPSSPTKKAADDDMDWLTMATGTPSKPSTPSSKPSTPSPSAPTPEAAENAKKSSAADWLGIKDNKDEDSDEYFKPNPSARKPPVPGQSQSRTQSPAVGQQRMQSPAAQSQARTQSPSVQSRGRSPSPVKGDSFDDLLSEIKKNSESTGGRGGQDLKERARAGSPAKSIENSLGLGEEINLDDLLKSKPETPSFLGESPAARSVKNAQSKDIFDPPPSRPASATKWESGSRRRRLSGSLDPGSDIFSKGPAFLADETDDFFPKHHLDAASTRGPQVSKEELALNLGSSRSPLPSASRTPLPHVASAPSNLHLQASLHPPASAMGTSLEFFPHTSPASGQVQFQSFTPASPATGRMLAEQLSSVRTPVPDQLQQQQQQQQQAHLQRMMQELQSQYSATMAAQQTMLPTSVPMQQPSLVATLDSSMPGSLAEAQARIRALEIEKQYAQSLLDSTKKRYDEEIEAIEKSYKNRMQIMEESNQKKESRLRSENEQLMETHLSKVRQLEQEKSELSEQQYRKLEDMERSKAQDLERLREQQRVLLTELKREQDQAIERLKQAKNLEINAVANANDTSKCLTAVVSQIQNNAKDLADLQMKVDIWNRQGLDEREISMKSKDEQLRLLQARLTKQEEDNDRERQRLEELIAKMETQLREQTRSLDEERWRLKQELARQESQSRALDEERRLWAEQQARERLALDRARETLLEEQRASTAQLAEERRQLTEEKTRFSVDQKINRDKMQQDLIKAAQAQAEYDMLMKSVAEERSKENERKRSLQQQEDRVKNEWNRLEQERSRLDTEKDKLESLAEQVRQRSVDIDRLTDASTRAQQEGDRALAEALRIQAQHTDRVQELKQQSENIRAMEKYIAEEKVKLAKERKEVENLKSASMCANCRSPLRPGIPHYQGGGMNSSFASMPMPYGGGSQPLALTAPPNSIENIAASIATDRSIRMWKIQAMKDQENLEEEVMFLEGLKHAPYHKTNSMK